jgi:predicted histone-like DNA-binding protein
MSIFYRLFQRRNPQDVTAPHKWYGFVKSVAKYDLHRLATRISRESTISEADVYAVLTSFLGVVPMVLDEGFIVDLGEFGSFRTSIGTIGADAEADFTINNIIRRKIVFTPGKLLKNAIKNFTFRKQVNDTADPAV